MYYRLTPIILVLYINSYRIGCFVTLIQFNTRYMLEIHYKWMAKIFCSIFIEQSTIQADIGPFSAISTKHNIVKCNVSCRFGQKITCHMYFTFLCVHKIHQMLIYSIVPHRNFLIENKSDTFWQGISIL